MREFRKKHPDISYFLLQFLNCLYTGILSAYLSRHFPVFSLPWLTVYGLSVPLWFLTYSRINKFLGEVRK